VTSIDEIVVGKTFIPVNKSGRQPPITILEEPKGDNVKVECEGSEENPFLGDLGVISYENGWNPTNYLLPADSVEDSQEA